METIFDLDNPLTSQRIFRNVMNSFTYPLRAYNITDGSSGWYSTRDGNGDIVLKGLCGVFLDNGVSFYVHGDENLAADIRAETYARPAAAEEADFVVIRDGFDVGILEKVSAGSLVNPHKGATVIVETPQLAGDVKVTAEGPGINGRASYFVCRRIADCLEKTAAMQIEYPKGFEFIFITRLGDICSVPRHINTRGEEMN